MRAWLRVAFPLLCAAAAILLTAIDDLPRTRSPLRDGKLLVVVVPSSVADSLISVDDPSALVVAPPARRAKDVFAQISAGAPAGDATTTREGKPGALYEAFKKRGTGLHIAEASGSVRNPMLHLALDAFRRPLDRTVRDDVIGLQEDIAEATMDPVDFIDPDAPVFVVTSRTAVDVTNTAAWRAGERAVLVLAVPPDLSAPLRVTVRGGGGGALVSRSTRRPGIVTAYDVAATIANHAAVPFSSVGRPIQSTRRDEEPDLDAMDSRFRRDAGVMQSLTVWTIVIGFGFGVLSALVLWVIGRPAGAARLASGGALATSGFLAGMFVSSPRGDVRALPILGLFAAGVLIRPGDRMRAAGTVFGVAGAATAVLAVAAAMRPGGEPALSFWGDPLVSSRFTGMQNFQASFVAAGALIGGALFGAGTAAAVAVSVAALAVVGAPEIGANYVGVATLTFGATVGIIVLRGRSLRLPHFALAAALAGVAFAIALFADASSASTHGGVAAREVSSGGIAAAADLALDRLRLNLRAILAFPGGVAWTIVLVGFDVLMIRWGSRKKGPAGAAIAACAAAGLAALALEDSGFKTGAVMSFPAMILYVLALAASGASSTRPQPRPERSLR